MKKALIISLAIAAVSCSSFTAGERKIIRESDSLMYVTTVPGDSAVLRTPCRDFTEKELRSQDFRTLCAKMLHTVTDPSQDGVGIAAPQVGISRRLILVQRLDKEGEPFECYANVQLDSLTGDIVRGREGCLSIPGLRGIVPRYSKVLATYTNTSSIARQSEWVEGYTARIFQHECDHLDGILYTDRADSLFTVAE